MSDKHPAPAIADFSNAMNFAGKTVLVVGGSSGIGNGIAHAFRELGADVHIWGTRANAAAYAGNEGSDMTGLTYTQVDVADTAAVEAAQPTFSKLDVLVLSQGTVMWAIATCGLPRRLSQESSNAVHRSAPRNGTLPTMPISRRLVSRGRGNSNEGSY